MLAAHFSKLEVDVDPDQTSNEVLVRDLVEFNPRLSAPAGTEPVYLDMKNLPEWSMTISAWNRRPARSGARFQNGDTLLARITPCLENGKTGYTDFMQDGEIGVGSTEYIVMRSRPGVPKPFSYFLATSERFRENAIRNMVGSSGRQRVSAADIQDFPLRKPEPAELERFGFLAESLLARIKLSVDESRTLTTLRDTLLPLLMSGRVRVKDVEEIVGDVV